jgi:hypothetical protein
MKNQVANWLRSIPGVSHVEPIIIQIEGRSWQGARYFYDDRWGYYLVGTRPRKENRVYLFDVTPGLEFFVSSYLDSPVVSRVREGFPEVPFGPNWMLGEWTGDRDIDASRKYHRELVKVT